MDQLSIREIEILNLAATWLAAIATLAAVIAALYLARRDDRIRLEVQASVMVGFVLGSPESMRREVTISVTNIGRRRAKVDSVIFRIGLFRTTNFTIVPSTQDPYSSTLPVMLDDGDTARFSYDAEVFMNDIADMIDRHKARTLLPWLPIRVGANASTGYMATKWADKSLSRLFREEWHKQRSTVHTT